MIKITQKMLVFYKLYLCYKEDPSRYVDTWEFLGEINVVELGRWGLMSYKAPTRLTDIFQENPWLLERRWHTGKSGTQYFQYRFNDPRVEKINDPSLRVFYKIIHERRKGATKNLFVEPTGYPDSFISQAEQAIDEVEMFNNQDH